MNQMNLFESDPEPIGFYGQPLSRATDPVTSKIAAESAAASAKAHETHKKLAQWLSTQPESKTCREIAEGAKKAYGMPQEVETLRKRVGELEDFPASVLGFGVRIASVRKCSFTGKLAETWETF